MIQNMIRYQLVAIYVSLVMSFTIVLTWTDAGLGRKILHATQCSDPRDAFRGRNTSRARIFKRLIVLEYKCNEGIDHRDRHGSKADGSGAAAIRDLDADFLAMA
jgi:hypothetical protein